MAAGTVGLAFALIGVAVAVVVVWIKMKKQDRKHLLMIKDKIDNDPDFLHDSADPPILKSEKEVKDANIQKARETKEFDQIQRAFREGPAPDAITHGTSVIAGQVPEAPGGVSEPVAASTVQPDGEGDDSSKPRNKKRVTLD